MRKGITVILTVVVALAVAIGFSACSGKSSSKNGKPTLRVQTADTYKPWGFANEKGEADGINIELFKKVAEYLKDDYNFVYEAVAQEVLTVNLETGKSDIIAMETNRTPETEQKFALGKVAKSTLVPRLITLKAKADQYKSWDDFQGKVVFAMPNADAAALEKYNASHKDNPIKIEYISDPATCVQALVDGRADAFVRGGFAAISFGEIYGVELKAVGTPVRIEESYFAFKKGTDPELVKKVDDIVAKLIADGTVSALHKKWYNGLDYTPPYTFDPTKD